MQASAEHCLQCLQCITVLGDAHWESCSPRAGPLCREPCLWHSLELQFSLLLSWRKTCDRVHRHCSFPGCFELAERFRRSHEERIPFYPIRETHVKARGSRHRAPRVAPRTLQQPQRSPTDVPHFTLAMAARGSGPAHGVPPSAARRQPRVPPAPLGWVVRGRAVPLRTTGWIL